MKITPIGAAGEVTGSCFLLESQSGRYLVDCGMFQGRRDDEARNWHFPFEPAEIDAVFLTHAHLDHCGRLPLLHAQGFRGQVYATDGTCELAEFILLDSAKIQQEDAARRTRRARRAGRAPEAALYDEQDVLHLLRYFQPHPYRETLRLGDLEIHFHQSGHILGSASIEVREGDVNVLFSGDVGSPKRNVVPDYTPPPECELVFCESTYGDRMHRSEDASVAELAEAINWAHAQGGNVIIPSFAMERTQDLLFQLRQMRERNEIPRGPVFLDSPLAINITRVYRRHVDDLDAATRAVVEARDDPFNFPGLTYSVTTQQSREINGQHGAIIIAGSGMCTGGRVVHHLKHNLWRADSAVIFIGYQASGTLGRQIIQRPPHVRIDNEPVAVTARIYTINGFSAHADQTGLQQWLSTTGHANILLNHGEKEATRIFADLLESQGRRVDIARAQSYDTSELAK